MNYEKIKELVIENRWKNKKKSGDEYRSLSKQIDNCIEYLKDENCIIHWMPMEKMKDDEIAEFINVYLDRSEENRLLLHNLNYKGMKYKYSDLIVKDEKNIRNTELIMKTTELKEYEGLKMLSVIPRINIIIFEAYSKRLRFRETLIELLRVIEDISCEIGNENAMFKYMGLKCINPAYIVEYIEVCHIMAINVLDCLVISNDNILDKEKVLLRIKYELKEIDTIIADEINKNEEKNSDVINIENCSLFFSQYLYNKAYYDEMEEIVEILQSETVQPVNNNKEEDMNKYICENKKIYDYNRKYNETLNFLKLDMVDTSMLCNLEYKEKVKVLFREIYIEITEYQRKKSITAVRGALQNEESMNYKWVLAMNCKVKRGYFRQKNLMKEYKLYNEICSEINKTFLRIYSLLDNENAYKLIYRVIFEYLNLFYDTDYSGIKLE